MSTPFVTSAGAGGAGAQGPQGAPGAAGAQGAQGAQGASGSSAAGPWDWADPFYESGGDQLAAVDPNLWTDASAIGGATACTLTQVQSRIMRVDTSGAGNRVQGALIAVGAGDFVRLLRLGFQRNVSALASSSVVLGGPAFVDGADVSTASWYGGGIYWGGTDYANSGYTFDNTSGAARWESYDGGTYGVIWGTLPSCACDCAFVRVGTTLTLYWADMRGQLNAVRSWTVSAGAGYVGVRASVLLGSADNVNILVYAYRESLSSLP